MREGGRGHFFFCETDRQRDVSEGGGREGGGGGGGGGREKGGEGVSQPNNV